MKKVEKNLARVLAGARFVDLFSGIGSFHYALRSYGAECVMASELDKTCQDTYEENHGMRPLGDITKIDENDVPAHDILCAGFPCQAFSINGKQKGFADDRGQLFYEICRITKAKRPKYLILENVKNLASHDKGKTIATIVGMLEQLGYVVSYGIMNSGMHGVPQARHRVFFFCSRGEKKYEFEVPKNPGSVCLGDVLEPIVDQDLMIDIQAFPHAIDTTPPAKRLKPIRIGHINSGRQGERIYHPNGLSITLSSGGGGIGARTGMYYINGKVRRLSPRECARLTGLPETFKLNKSRNQCYRQFGNSLVVDVVQSMIETAYDTNVLS